MEDYRHDQAAEILEADGIKIHCWIEEFALIFFELFDPGFEDFRLRWQDRKFIVFVVEIDQFGVVFDALPD